MLRSAIIPLALCLIAASCASAPKQADNSETQKPNSFNRAVDSTRAGITEAALTPVEDLNLKRDEIPELLQQIKDPYLLPQSTSCGSLAAEVKALDGVLGRDWDTPTSEEERKLGDQAADGASSALLDAVASEAGGLIPFRGIVRTVSGAKAWNRKVLRAYQRGSHRRTFLKGLGSAQGCAPPAAPLPPPVEEQKIFFK